MLTLDFTSENAEPAKNNTYRPRTLNEFQGGEKFSNLALERSSELSSVDNASFVIANKSASFILSPVTNFRISSTIEVKY
uniref:Uncharacterized protein n=1 Tax=Glossina brevipalpis TaxID=37001 RepID=A0A1A9X5D1_9MUSC